MDVACIHSVEMIQESFKEEFLNGKVLDVLLQLMGSSKTVKEISKALDTPPFSVQLYLKRLLENHLICIKEEMIVEGRIEKTYELATTDIEILNYIERNSKNKDQNIELSAQHFSTLTKNIVKNIHEYKDKPHKVKAYFIKTDSEKMSDFKQELEALFQKYQDCEDLEASETYGFICIR